MAQTAKGLRADLVPAYRDVKRPVLIVRGEAEQAGFGGGAGEDEPASRRTCRSSSFPGADHYVNEVSPEITLRAITNFIDA